MAVPTISGVNNTRERGNECCVEEPTDCPDAFYLAVDIRIQNAQNQYSGYSARVVASDNCVVFKGSAS